MLSISKAGDDAVQVTFLRTEPSSVTNDQVPHYSWGLLEFRAWSLLFWRSAVHSELEEGIELTRLSRDDQMLRVYRALTTFRVFRSCPESLGGKIIQ